MAEVLFAAVNLGSYERGDPIIAKPDGWQWGTAELLAPASGGKFCRVIISDLTAQRANEIIARYDRPAVEGDAEFDAPDPEDRVVVLGRRVWWLRWSEVPNSVRNTLNNSGVYGPVTKSQVSQYIRRRDTDEQL